MASPSLDCVSRTCLRVPLGRELPPGSVYPAGNSGLCTAECSADSDCDRVPESPCTLGFTCGVAVTVGPFCCKKFCICKDYVVIPDTGELAEPMACDSSERRRTRAATSPAAPATRSTRSARGSRFARLTTGRPLGGLFHFGIRAPGVADQRDAIAGDTEDVEPGELEFGAAPRDVELRHPRRPARA